jgi:hypothetical protein
LCRRGYGNEVIEFSGPDDSITDPSRSKNVVIQYTAYDDFKGRGKTEVVNSPLGFSGDEVVRRADAMVQKGPGRPKFGSYHAGKNNCEHFATWCRCGERSCGQWAAGIARVFEISGRDKAR